MKPTIRTGWCNVAFPLDDPSHRRCNGGMTANPDGVFQRCHCPCHDPEGVL